MALEQTVVDLTVAVNKHTESVLAERASIRAEANEAVATINSAMDAKIEGIDSVYVDVAAGLDTNSGSSAAPVKTIIYAIKTFSKYNRKLRVYLQSGQDHLFDDTVYSYSDEVRFLSWNGGAVAPRNMHLNGSTLAEIKAAWPSIVSVSPAGANQSGGILTDTAMRTAFHFSYIVIETAPIPVGLEASLTNGLFFRRGAFDSDKTISTVGCYFALKSPFIHLTIGSGLLNISSYYDLFDFSGLTSGDPASDRFVVNEGGKPVCIYIAGVVLSGVPAGEVYESRLLSHRSYASAVPEETPFNITSNLNLSRAVAPLI